MKQRVLIIFTILTITAALSASGFSLSGVGARAISMGGAMRGLGDDYTTIYWNPAGLSFLENTQAALCLATITPAGDYTPSLTDATTAPMGWPGITDGKTYDAEKKTWAFPSLYFTYQSESKLDWGVGVYVPYGLGATWDIWEAPDYMVTGVDSLGQPVVQAITWPDGITEKEYESSIGIVDFHPTVSYQLADNMSVGLGVSVMYGMISITKLMPQAPPTLTYMPIIMELEGTGMGFGANMGFMWQAAENLRVGLSGKLPTSIKLSGDATITAYLNSAVAASMGMPGAVALESKPDGDATVNLPADAGLGLSWLPMPQLTLVGEITWTGWDCLEYIEVEFDGLNPMGAEMEDSKMNTMWENTMRYSLGAEYRFNEVGPFNLLALRTGFYYDETPIPDDSQDPLWPDVGDKSSFNFGLGLGLQNWQLDLGYEYMGFEERKLESTNWSADGPENMAGSYNTTVNAFNAGVMYRF